MENNYDFCGWATRVNVRCSDGRVILKDAFKHNDGRTVPIVWNHQHNDPLNVLGHALLENRDEGVYVYGKFNDTENGEYAKELVKHGDISQLSIYANQLQQHGHNVEHGEIREVSLVLAGANPGAYIESVMQHADGSDESAVIYTGKNIELYHAEEKESDSDNADKKDEDSDGEETVGDIINTMNEKQKNVLYALVGQALDGEEEVDEDSTVKHSDDDDDGETIGDVIKTMNEKQKKVLYALVGQALSENQNDEGDDKNMKHNVFDTEDLENENVLSHADQSAIIEDAKRCGSLRDAFLAHATDSHGNTVTYGIADIDYLFPDARNVNREPDFIKRDTSWVTKVVNGAKHLPFSRVKSTHANVTADEARAKGYVKGKRKVEEVITLLKRTTDPTTVYKKQKLDRDDVIDITDFDVVAWLKGEMRFMLDEEIARAGLVGDGRSTSDDDHIPEDKIRPIWKDDPLYTIRKRIEVTEAMTAEQRAKAFIKAMIKARKDYKGSGNPTLFTTEDMLTDCLLIEDGVGRPLYDTVDKLATKLRVKEIVTVPVMENLSYEGTGSDTNTYYLLGIIVNMSDYAFGADKGGSINMFDDFDIDFNQMKYLIETRCSGALIKPYSAIVCEAALAGTDTDDDDDDDQGEG